MNDYELSCPSVDVCAFCTDVYCDGISCVKDLDPENNDDLKRIEELQEWVRLGRIQQTANRFLALVENRA